MLRDELSVLAAFMTVAEERSFTRAARRLGVSASALSHAMRGLEERVGVRLLARTTRSVAPTEAGEQLLARLGPALGEVSDALDALSRLRDKPAGHVRLLVSPTALSMVLAPKLTQFARAYPDVVVEITTTYAGRFDLVAGRYDAGIQLGEFIERDMIAVRVSEDQRAAIVGSPAYFATRPMPTSPRDLTAHQCLNFGHAGEGVYRWEFEKDGETLTVAVRGPLTLDSVDLLTRAALDGLGLTYLFEAHAAPHLASGALVRVLDDWCPPFAGYFLYYPSRRQQPPALAALVELLRLR